jgi:hypothetical protein
MNFLRTKIKVIALSLVLMTGFLSQAGIVAYAGGASTGKCGSTAGSSKDEILSGVGESGTVNCNGKGVTDAAHTFVSILSLVVGIIAIIIVVISGLRFITSGGDASKVSSAKTSLIYALIGVAVAALAQVLIHFVLYQANNNT